MASRSVRRFRQVLVDLGLEDTVLELEVQARTAQEAASALACSTGQIVKSLVFTDTEGGTVLVLAAGDVRVDVERVGDVHGHAVTLANAAHVREAAGYAIGGVPPFGHRQDLPTLIDPSLRRWTTVWAAAGTPHHVFSLSVDDLLRVTGGHLVEVG